MEKGDETQHGIYLGERLVERDKPLTAKPSDYPDDPDGNPGIFLTHALVYVFDADGEEVEVPAESL